MGALKSDASGSGAPRAGWDTWTAELTPILLTIGLIWAKLAYASAFVRSEWWSNTATIAQWMRPSHNLLEVVSAYPQIASGTLACLLLACAPLLLLPRRWRLLALIALNVGLTVLAVADLLHTRFYGDVLSTGSFTTPRMVKDILPSILDIARTLDPIFGIDLALALIIVPAHLWQTRRLAGLPMPVRSRMGAGFLALGLAVVSPTLATRWQQGDALFSPASPRIEAAAVVGLLPYHVLEIVAPRASVGGPPAAQVERVRRYLADERGRRGPQSPLFGAARGANVILISAESLQAFPIGLEVNGQPIMPRLAALARESLTFPNYHEQTYLGTTSDAQFGVLQGLHPRPVGFVAMDYAQNHFRALPRVLADQGYETFAAVAASSDFWNADRLNPAYGFQHAYYEDAFQLTEYIQAWLADDAFFGQMVPRLANREHPYLAYLQSSSNHHPYELAAQYRLLDLGPLDGTLLGDYLQSAHVFDQSLGRFLEQLRADGVLDQTVFVLYGDHQGFLGDPPALGQLVGRPAWNEYDRFWVRKRTPLVVRLPHGAHAGERAVVGGHLDVAPTILSLLGVSVDEGDYGMMLGRDLTAERPSLTVFRDGSFADDRYYWVQRFGADASAGCYEIATGASVDCALLEPRRQAARERLEISDLIVQGDLIPALRTR
ncbi:MAG: LTA synthase family protein [Chloroflexi bacterium]|nr:LTA synthase family protein [Chloroflexota bacterium]